MVRRVAPTVPIGIEELFREKNAEDYALWQRAQTLLDDHQGPIAHEAS